MVVGLLCGAGFEDVGVHHRCVSTECKGFFVVVDGFFVVVEEKVSRADLGLCVGGLLWVFLLDEIKSLDTSKESTGTQHLGGDPKLGGKVGGFEDTAFFGCKVRVFGFLGRDGGIKGVGLAFLGVMGVVDHADLAG